MSTNIRGETGRSTPTHTAVNVTTSSAVILAANTARKHLLIQNNSTEVIYMKLGAAAVLNEGIILAGSIGFPFEMSEKLGNLYTGAVYAIHGGSGNKVVTIAEGI